MSSTPILRTMNHDSPDEEYNGGADMANVSPGSAEAAPVNLPGDPPVQPVDSAMRDAVDERPPSPFLGPMSPSSPPPSVAREPAPFLGAPSTTWSGFS